MARLENGSYDEIVAHLERELKLNPLEESDDLPMATMNSPTTTSKTPQSTGQLSDITCNHCKEKGHKVKDCKKLKKKKRKMPNKASRRRRKHTRSVALVAKRTTRKNDVGKVLVHILNPNAPDQMTPLTVSPLQRPRNRKIDQHLQTHNPHPLMMSQNTNFATTPIQRTDIRPPIHQVGSSNKNFSSVYTTIDGLSLCCLAATDGQSYHHHL